jgi:hypothetical protein
MEEQVSLRIWLQGEVRLLSMSAAQVTPVSASRLLLGRARGAHQATAWPS